jgi:lactonase
MKIESEEIFVFGAAFDRENNLFTVAAYNNRTDRRLLKITPKQERTVILQQSGVRMCGISIHKNGRLYIACLTGELLSLEPDGQDLTHISARYQGKPQIFNEHVFDSEGHLFTTDFSGQAANPTGGVYRFSPDFKEVKPIIQNVTSPNGIAIGPNGTTLWTGASRAGELYRIELMADHETVREVTIPYRFTGSGGADGIAIDELGNVYVAINYQGRVLIFHKSGVPIASVLIPGRDNGQLYRTTNLAFKPGTDEVYLAASGKGGGYIFKFKGLAKGLPLYSHQ